MNDLDRCPFCGGSAEIVKGEFFFKVAYGVICSCCNASIPPITTGQYIFFGGKRDVFVTDEMAANALKEKWNNRIST